MTLKPILDAYGIRSVHMTSLQSLSGAGEKRIRADSEYRRQVQMNVLPYIEKEEEKVKRETQKILGTLSGGRIVDADIRIGCTCTRVFVDRVHTEVVYVDTEHNCSVEKVRDTLLRFRGEPQRLRLPSAPAMPIEVLEDQSMPQPRLHTADKGMTILVGRLRIDGAFQNGISYVLTSDNFARGAGAGAVLNAEYLKSTGLL